MKKRNAEESSINEILAPIGVSIRKYWKLVVGPALAVFAIAALVSFKLPNFYQSESLIFIQPQRIASKVVDNPEKKDDMRERLEGIVQEILSRPRLRAVIERQKVYPDLTGLEGTEYAVQRFKKDIEIAPATSAGGVTLMQTFRLAFKHEDPKVTFEVTKALANLFIEESLIDKRTEVQGTEEFLEAELTEARKKLEQTEDKVQEFVSANFGKLPEHLDQSIARLETLRSQLHTNSELLAANMQRKANLESEFAEVRRLGAMFGAGGGMGSNSVVDSSDPYQSLAQLESALVVLTSRYSEQHPDVIATRRRIQALKEQIAQERASGGSRGKAVDASRLIGASPLALNVKRQLGEVDVQLTALRRENDNLKEQIELLQKNIEAMPVKEQDLLRIRRDYTNVKANYERLLGAREDAGLQSSMIKSQKATQFRIVEPAEMPMIPAGPNRSLIIIGGLAAAILLFFGVPPAVYFLKNAYQLRDEVESDLGLPVLAVIPPMNSPDAIMTARRRTFTSIFGSAASVAAACVIVFWVF